MDIKPETKLLTKEHKHLMYTWVAFSIVSEYEYYKSLFIYTCTATMHRMIFTSI